MLFESLVKLDACAHHNDSGKHVLQCAVDDVAERWVQGLRPHHSLTGCLDKVNKQMGKRKKRRLRKAWYHRGDAVRFNMCETTTSETDGPCESNEPVRLTHFDTFISCGSYMHFFRFISISSTYSVGRSVANSNLCL